jgi:hypothetical protein
MDRLCWLREQQAHVFDPSMAALDLVIASMQAEAKKLKSECKFSQAALLRRYVKKLQALL